MAPGELAEAAGVSVFVMRKIVNVLAKEKRVDIVGKTNSRRIGLPGKMTARGNL